MQENNIKDALIGVSIGDALGVPVEFMSRRQLKENPVTGLRGYGVWDQPSGTWSDDSSLTFCLAESLCNGYNLKDIANKFVAWLEKGYWGAHHKVFDVGNATRISILRLKDGESPLYSGELDQYSNGNGSLMRILPLVFYIKDKPVEDRFKYVKEVSAITHGHFRSVFACFVYLEYAIGLLKKLNKRDAYLSMQYHVHEFIKYKTFNPDELKLFSRILSEDISESEEEKIKSSGYVIDSLEASLWCLLRSDSFEETVLKAVNLGGDTDTTGAIAGGLAGLCYGFERMPSEWLAGLVRRDDIIALAERLEKNLYTS